MMLAPAHPVVHFKRLAHELASLCCLSLDAFSWPLGAVAAGFDGGSMPLRGAHRFAVMPLRGAHHFAFGCGEAVYQIPPIPRIRCMKPQRLCTFRLNV